MWTAQQMKEAVEVAWKAAHGRELQGITIEYDGALPSFDNWTLELPGGDFGIYPTTRKVARLGKRDGLIVGYVVYGWKHVPEVMSRGEVIAPPDAEQTTLLGTDCPWSAAKKLALLDHETEIDHALESLGIRWEAGGDD